MFAAYNAPTVLYTSYTVLYLTCSYDGLRMVLGIHFESFGHSTFFSVAVVLPLSIPLAAPPTQKNTTLFFNVNEQYNSIAYRRISNTRTLQYYYYYGN